MTLGARLLHDPRNPVVVCHIRRSRGRFQIERAAGSLCRHHDRRQVRQNRSQRIVQIVHTRGRQRIRKPVLIVDRTLVQNCPAPIDHNHFGRRQRPHLSGEIPFTVMNVRALQRLPRHRLAHLLYPVRIDRIDEQERHAPIRILRFEVRQRRQKLLAQWTACARERDHHGPLRFVVRQFSRSPGNVHILDIGNQPANPSRRGRQRTRPLGRTRRLALRFRARIRVVRSAIEVFRCLIPRDGLVAIRIQGLEQRGIRLQIRPVPFRTGHAIITISIDRGKLAPPVNAFRLVGPAHGQPAHNHQQRPTEQQPDGAASTPELADAKPARSKSAHAPHQMDRPPQN